jgi:hypothetical protein
MHPLLWYPFLCVLIFLGAWGFGSFITFLVIYMFNLIDEDWSGPCIALWPIMLPIILTVYICRKIPKYWIIIGGPKLKGIAVKNRDRFERDKAYEDLRIEVHRAQNAGVPNDWIVDLVKDIIIKEVMES